MKLEPTEAQRKAMVNELVASVLPTQVKSEDARAVVDAQIAAANSIPEGPPVGTIARRPDGTWTADRRVDADGNLYWLYSVGAFYELGDGKQPLVHDADSWPQIRPDQWPDPTAQQEPTEEDMHPDAVYGREYAATNGFRDHLPKAPREPRVVDRLGVEEQGSRWRDTHGDEWRFCDGVWLWKSPPRIYWQLGCPDSFGPFQEIPGARVLPSLDCEEARDGTEWKFRLNGEPRSLVYRNTGWRYGEVGDRIGGRCGVSDGHTFLREFAPYIEVVGDPS